MKFEHHRLTKEKKYCEDLFKHYLKIKTLKKTNLNYKNHIRKAISNLELANFLLEEHNFSIKEKLPNRNIMIGASLYIIIQYIILHLLCLQNLAINQRAILQL